MGQIYKGQVIVIMRPKLCLPGNTGINLSAKLVAELAQHPNIMGIKDSGGNIVQIASNAAVTARFGIAGLKAALDMLGYYGGDPRPPLLPIGEVERAELKEILTRTQSSLTMVKTR